MLELARAARLAGRAEKSFADSAKLLDRGAALQPGTAQQALFHKAVHGVNKTTVQDVFGMPLAKQDFQASSKLTKAAELTGTSGLGAISGRLDDAAEAGRGVRLIESAEQYPQIHVTGPMLGAARPLADVRSSAHATVQQLAQLMPDLRNAARGQRQVVAGATGTVALGAAGAGAYVVSR